MPTDVLIFQIKSSNGATRELKRIAYDTARHRFQRLRIDTTPTAESPRGFIAFDTCPSSDTQLPADLNQLSWIEECRESIQARTVEVITLSAELSSGTSCTLDNPGHAIFDNFQPQTQATGKGGRSFGGRGRK